MNNTEHYAEGNEGYCHCGYYGGGRENSDLMRHLKKAKELELDADWHHVQFIDGKKYVDEFPEGLTIHNATIRGSVSGPSPVVITNTRATAPDPLTPEDRDHHDLAWSDDTMPCIHDYGREGCTGCAHDAALRAVTPDPAEPDIYSEQWWVNNYILAHKSDAKGMAASKAMTKRANEVGYKED